MGVQHFHTMGVQHCRPHHASIQWVSSTSIQWVSSTSIQWVSSTSIQWVSSTAVLTRFHLGGRPAAELDMDLKPLAQPSPLPLTTAPRLGWFCPIFNSCGDGSFINPSTLSSAVMTGACPTPVTSFSRHCCPLMANILWQPANYRQENGLNEWIWLLIIIDSRFTLFSQAPWSENTSSFQFLRYTRRHLLITPSL